MALFEGAHDLFLTFGVEVFVAVKEIRIHITFLSHVGEDLGRDASPREQLVRRVAKLDGKILPMAPMPTTVFLDSDPDTVTQLSFVDLDGIMLAVGSLAAGAAGGSEFYAMRLSFFDILYGWLVVSHDSCSSALAGH